MKDLKNIIEALLFVSPAPLSAERIRELIVYADAAEIKDTLQSLVREHQERNGGFTLHEVAGGFQFRTRPEHRQWVEKLLAPQPVRLSRAALETLAIVAYHQPVLRSDVEHIRGVNSGATLRFLLEKKLIRILGRKEIAGRPLLYGTTKKFLETFDLKDLKDLPAPDEIQHEEENPNTGADPVDPGTQKK
ncbi:MAG: SMC-Scp complex subunit ScpB [Desulfobacterales bacterium]|nr:SMC-Scp complex subunit ScpB [Desulfobacterales bacterium]